MIPKPEILTGEVKEFIDLERNSSRNNFEVEGVIMEELKKEFSLTKTRNKLNKIAAILSRIEAIENVAIQIKDKHLREQLVNATDKIKDKEVELLRTELKTLLNLIEGQL